MRMIPIAASCGSEVAPTPPIEVLGATAPGEVWEGPVVYQNRSK